MSACCATGTIDRPVVLEEVFGPLSLSSSLPLVSVATDGPPGAAGVGVGFDLAGVLGRYLSLAPAADDGPPSESQGWSMGFLSVMARAGKGTGTCT